MISNEIRLNNKLSNSTTKKTFAINGIRTLELLCPLFSADDDSVRAHDDLGIGFRPHLGLGVGFGRLSGVSTATINVGVGIDVNFGDAVGLSVVKHLRPDSQTDLESFALKERSHH